MTLLSRLTRPFEEKATGGDGAKFCKGDNVLVKFGHQKTPVKVVTLSEHGIVDVEGIDKNGNKAMATTYEGNLYNPETTEATSEHIPNWAISGGLGRFIGEDVAVEAGWPTNGMVKAKIKEVDDDGIITVADQAGNELQVTANCIKDPKDVEFTNCAFVEADASCFAPPEVK